MTENTPRRALVVVDVQNEYDSDAHPAAGLPIVGRRESLAAIGRAIDVAGAHGVPVVLIRQSEDPAAPVFATGSTGWQLNEVVASRPHEIVLDKHWPGAFTGTGLESWLREHRIDTVSVAGYMVQHCVDSTVKQAYHLGFAVELLTDATGTLDVDGPGGRLSAEQVVAAVVAIAGTEMARVVDVERWAGAMAAGESLPEASLLETLKARVAVAG